MFLVLALGNYFETQEGSLVVFYIISLGDLMIGTCKGSLVGLSTVLPLGSPPGMAIGNTTVSHLNLQITEM